MLKTLINYLKNSGLVVKIVLNPLHWSIKFNPTGPSDLDPKRHALNAAFGPIEVVFVIDDGSW